MNNDFYYYLISVHCLLDVPVPTLVPESNVPTPRPISGPTFISTTISPGVAKLSIHT